MIFIQYLLYVCNIVLDVKGFAISLYLKKIKREMIHSHIPSNEGFDFYMFHINKFKYVYIYIYYTHTQF